MPLEQVLGALVVAGAALLTGDGFAMAGGRAGSPAPAVGAIATLLFVAATAARYRDGR